MKTTKALTAFAVWLGLALRLAAPTTASAQTFYGMAAGVNVARTVPVDRYDGLHGHTSHGFAVQASVGRRLTRRLGWRVDAFASQVSYTQPSDFAGVLCAYLPPPGVCCGICPRGTSTDLVGVTGLAASEVVSVIPSASGIGMYVIAGMETNYLYRHPDAQGRLLLGGSVGTGVALPVGGRFQAVLEARYHALIGAPSPRSLVPVTFGIRF